MEKYLVPVSSSVEKHKHGKRRPWSRSVVEVNGRFDLGYRHHLSGLIIQSYSEIAALPHTYHVNGESCVTHYDWIFNSGSTDLSYSGRRGVSSLDFDSKGVYLAAATITGCLTVHDFDNIQISGLVEDEANQLLHLSTHQQLDAVRWNLANQDEIACTSKNRGEICIFDIGYISSEPVEILRKAPKITVHGFKDPNGFSDIAFSSDDKSRLLASDMSGNINVWDRRLGDFPCLELITNSLDSLNSIKLSADNEIVYGASNHGTIFMWDLRGGRSKALFRNHTMEYFPPLTKVKLAHELQKIPHLKAQSDIISREIHSIDIDPSCPYQLAFHLDDGWSGVLDTNKLQVTHIHCPPPPWLDGINNSIDISFLRRPCWLPMNSIYVIGSSSSNGLYLLDFYPDCTSPSHVDYIEDLQSTDKEAGQSKQNRFLPLSERVTACVAHPLDGTILAGTKLSSLLVISQSRAQC